MKDTTSDTDAKIAFIMAKGDATVAEAMQALDENGGDVSRAATDSDNETGTSKNQNDSNKLEYTLVAEQPE